MLNRANASKRLLEQPCLDRCKASLQFRYLRVSFHQLLLIYLKLLLLCLNSDESYTGHIPDADARVVDT